ncbi:hypothetical protein RJT34_04073 [Clitoria ternatea]|uniref:Cyclotide n=1 Tax=Clitoria ternatea TaxID=43366 RepID=A0AAN9Q5R2_CLITE
MEIAKGSSILFMVLVFVTSLIQANAYYYRQCSTRCYGKYIKCPGECPSSESTNPKAKVCHIDCDKPLCRSRKPNCNAPGSGCYDPRFIGGDGRARDYTWIQALGILFNSKSISLEATKTPQWNDNVDHLKFTYNGNPLVLPEGPLSTWYTPQKDVKVKRVGSKNSVIVTLEDVAEILVNVVPVTNEDDRVHNYQVPSDDCFAHLEVQFRFFGLSPKVDRSLGGLIGWILRTQQSLVWQCLLLEEKIDTGLPHCFLQIVLLVCSHRKLLLRKRRLK